MTEKSLCTRGLLCQLNVDQLYQVLHVCLLKIVTSLLTGQSLGVPMNVFGTETHMTAIVGMALGKTPVPDHPPSDPGHTANFLLASSSNQNVSVPPIFGWVVV